MDELLLLLAVGVAVYGATMLADRKLPGRKRMLGVPLVVVAAGIGASPFIFRFGVPRMAAIRITSSARVEVDQPQAGAFIRGKSIDVRVRLTGGRIVAKTTTRLRPDEGHLHLSIDGRLSQMSIKESQRFDVGGLSAGPHLLEVEFVAADHGPFRPRVRSFTRFTVERQ
jgi:hypothetical protein